MCVIVTIYVDSLEEWVLMTSNIIDLQFHKNWTNLENLSQILKSNAFQA